MATATSNASGPWSTDIWDGGSGAGGIPVDGDAVVIAAGHNVLMDADLSAYTGLFTVTITGGATPGMLYFKDSTSGHLKIRTGYNLIGTTDTNKGRLLANSDGVWGNTGSLAYADKAVIDLQGTAKIDTQHLDIALYCTQPTNEFVHVYGTKFDFAADTDVDPATNLITLNDTAPVAGTDVVLVAAAGATLPTPLVADMLYYVRNNSGNDCKLATTNSDATIVDITADGSGTIYLLTEQASATAELNVLEDVTADSWSAAADHDAVVLVDCLAPANYDQQRTTISAIDDADTITLAAVVDSAQFAGAKLFLSSRNVSIRSAGTTAAQPIVDYASATTASGVFQCEIRNTAGSGTTFYGYGINNGTGHTISGTISGCSNGISDGSGHIISGTISGCSNGINSGSGHTISGTISGCTTGISSGSGHTSSGTISGCSTGIYSGSGHISSGTISGCTNGINSGSGHTISGTISGCSNGIYSGSGHTISGTIRCTYGIYSGSGHTISGTISGCTFGIYLGSGYTISGTISGCIYGINSSYGHTISGTISGCIYGINAGYGYIVSGTISGCTTSFKIAGDVIVKSGADVAYTFYNRGTTVGEDFRVSVEDLSGTGNAYKVYDQYGDVIKTACDGTGDAPSADPDSGNGYCVEASNIQAIIATNNPLVIIPNHRIWMTAAEHTVTYKVQTTYAGISAGGLVLSCSYISTASPVARTITTNAPAIDQRSGDTDWTQTLAVTFTPAAAGWVDFEIKLTEYESGNEVYVWPTPVIS